MDNESFMEIDFIGNIFWRNKEGLLHRLDGPAMEYIGGEKEWYQNGKLHRLDGPAIEYPSGYKVWYKNAVLHRIDGPAKEFSNGKKSWYKNGRRFKNKDTFFRALNKKEKEIALFSEDFLNG
jgi:hypothetical protein